MGRGTKGWLGMATAVLLAVACGPKTVHYTVRPGDSVSAIARRYGVSYERLVRVNRLRDPERIAVGRRLTIPGATEPLTPAPPRHGTITPIGFVPAVVRGSTGFQWPVSGGTVTSAFGRRESGHHDGIDIQAPLGSPVQAARPGRVIYSGQLRGYGNLVIIDHGDGLATVYAHNQRNFVQPGTVVRAGQAIATLGATGQTSAPHLHFEVRKQNLARDPLLFLPSMSVASRRTQGVP